jgi:hypothetical protein
MSKLIALVAFTAAISSAPSMAVQYITNGDFETGDYTGWTANVQSGSNGNLAVVPNTGGTTPISGEPTQSNPNGGRYYSISDQGGPGSYALTQAFTLTSAKTVTISFDLFANNWAGANYNNGRDYTVNPNQNAVVDLLVGSATAFTEAAPDIVATLWGPGSDNLTGNPNPWSSYSTTLTLAAGTYQLRFAETDNQLFFNQGVDNVSVASVPEPASWALMIVGFGMVGAAVRSRRRLAIAA